jgi:hypothetical protein
MQSPFRLRGASISDRNEARRLVLQQRNAKAVERVQQAVSDSLHESFLAGPALIGCGFAELRGQAEKVVTLARRKKLSGNLSRSGMGRMRSISTPTSRFRVTAIRAMPPECERLKRRLLPLRNGFPAEALP